MQKNPKSLFFSILFSFFISQFVFAESLKDLEKELNEIKQEIGKLNSAPIKNPILPVVDKFGKAITGQIINSSPNSKVVTYIPIADGGKVILNAKPQQGILLSDSDIKDIAIRQSANQAAALAAEQARSQVSIDKALKELDNAANFMKESYLKGDVDAAIAALAVLDVALDDVAKNVPYEFSSTIIKEGEDFDEEQMKKVLSITKNMNNKKTENYDKLKKHIDEATDKGLQVEEITKKIILTGIKTPKLNDYYAQSSNIELRENLSDSIKYSKIIGKSSEQVDLSVKRAIAFQSGDPKKIRALDIEKYGKAAGLSKDMINKGINAVYNGDINFEKQITKNIFNKLKSNSNYKFEPMTDSEIFSLVDQGVAVEKAAYKILNSNIDFGNGTNAKKVKNLTDEIEKILQGKVDKSKIEKIKYNLSRSTFTVDNKENVAANLIAEVSGKDYVEALLQMNIGSKTIAEQAAAYEAITNGDIEIYKEITRSSNKSYLSTMSTEEVNKLTSVYGSIIKSKNLTNQLNQDINVAIADKDVIKKNEILKNAKLTSETKKNTFNKKRLEVENLQKEYKQAIEDQKIGKKSLSDVLAIQTQVSKELNDLSKLQYAADEAQKAAIEAASVAGEAKAVANVAKETASGLSGIAAGAVTEVSKEVAQVTEDVQKNIKAQLGEAKTFAQELDHIREMVNQETALVAKTVDELKKELKEEIKQSGIVDTVADLKKKEREAWAEYSNYAISDPGWAASRRIYLDVSYKLGQAELKAKGINID